jgi:hypothetical protein
MRIPSRFLLVYLTLFAAATQIAGSLFLIPGVAFRGLGRLWPMREATLWLGSHLFGIGDLAVPDPAIGETAFFYVQTFWLLILAGLITLVLSTRYRESRLWEWLRLLLQLGLAATMFEYGMTKVIPNQFSAPSLNILVTPTGDLSLNTLLWTAIGSAPAYQIFTGIVELAGGILVLWPRTRTLGALVSLAALAHVLLLNFTYDIGLKLTTIHLVLIALVVLSPDFSRIGRFVRNRPIESAAAPVFRSARVRSVLPAVLAVIGMYLIGIQGWVNWNYWHVAGSGAPRSALYGIWEVEEMAVDGVVGPPAENDYDRRWRRVIFDDPGQVSFQRVDDSFARYGSSIQADRLVLTKGDSRTWTSGFSIARPSAEEMVLEGTMDGHTIRVSLRRMELDAFRLLSSPFRWVRPAVE